MTSPTRHPRRRRLLVVTIAACTALAAACVPPPSDPPVPTPCAVGSYNSSTGAAPCTPAPAGFFVDTPGALGATPCPHGTFQPEAGRSSCLLAPIGSYVDAIASIAATPCPPDTTTAALGSTSASDCVSTSVPSFAFERRDAATGALGAIGFPSLSGVASSPFATSVTTGLSITATVPCLPGDPTVLFEVLRTGPSGLEHPSDNQLVACGTSFSVNEPATTAYAPGDRLVVLAWAFGAPTVAYPTGTPITFHLHGDLGSAPTQSI